MKAAGSSKILTTGFMRQSWFMPNSMLCIYNLDCRVSFSQTRSWQTTIIQYTFHPRAPLVSLLYDQSILNNTNFNTDGYNPSTTNGQWNSYLVLFWAVTCFSFYQLPFISSKAFQLSLEALTWSFWKQLFCFHWALVNQWPLTALSRLLNIKGTKSFIKLFFFILWSANLNLLIGRK